MKNTRLFSFLLIFSSLFFDVGDGIAQLDSIHWVPPLHTRKVNQVEDHYLYISTPSTTPFTITITDGGGIIQSSQSISNSNPCKYYIGYGQLNNEKVMVPIDSLNKPLKRKGLVIEGDGEFYVNFRAKSGSQAGILTCKGTVAKGNEFRLGSFPQSYYSESKNFVAGFMATENNTIVKVSDYDTAVTFAGSTYIHNDSLTINLNKGECYVLSGYADTAANMDGFVGALVQSNKPIVVNTGNMNGSISPNGGQDIGIDQLVPVSSIGNKYSIIAGGGNPTVEVPFVVAHHNGTEIYINGSTTPLATIDAGEYYIIPHNNYQILGHKNMYVRTSQPAYMFQAICGANQANTNGLNFIPPFNCNVPQFIDMVPSIDSIGNVGFNGGLLLTTIAGSIVEVNNIVQGGSQAVLGTNWETYKITGLNGDAKVTSTGPLAACIYGSSGNAGYAGFFSGFSGFPTPSISMQGMCYPITLYLDSGDYSFGNLQWLLNGAPITNANNDTILVNSPGIYSIAVNNGSCSDTSNVIEITQSKLQLNASGVAPTCHGYCDAEITLASTGGSSPYQYTWPNSSNTTNFLDGLCAGVYILTVTDSIGCTDTVKHIISGPDEILINIEGIGNSCPKSCDGSAEANPAGGTSPYTYSWSTNSSLNNIITDLCEGLITITVTDANGCIKIDSAIIETQHPIPTADFYHNPENPDLYNLNVRFFDLSYDNISNWSWTFYNNNDSTILGTSTQTNPTFTYPPDTGYYPVQLVVQNYAGCEDDTIINVHVDGIYNLFVPNAFSPNGDGLNDFFFPKGIGVSESNYQFMIFDRWGELIFITEKYGEYWDGTAKNLGGTEIVQQGTYVWKILTQEAVKGNTKHEYIGHVTLIK